jgi:hypothetical protein
MAVEVAAGRARPAATSTAILCTFETQERRRIARTQAKTCDTIATTGANFKTAAFRVTVPPTLLARADGDRVMRFLLRCVSPQSADFVAKVGEREGNLP